MAKDAAIYGLSSIVRQISELFISPIYAAAMTAASGAHGIVTEIYAWTALWLVLLTYGMETTFFRFVNKAENRKRYTRPS